MNYKIGQYSIIKDNVSIGKNVTIGSYTKIMQDTIIGDNTIIMDYVKLMPGTRIGNNCKLDDYVTTSGYVLIGNRVRIKRCSMIGQAVEIEDDVWIGSHVCTTRIKYPKVIKEEDEKEEWIRIGKKSMIGSGALILAGAIIEEGVIVGAGSLITKNCQANGLYVGRPAKLVRVRNV